MQSAKDAGLRYVADSMPGIARKPAGRSFRYVSHDGSALRDRASLARIRALAIPPAWRDVWICPRDDGHLQATGRDARGRKQYRYHVRWRETRDESKFDRLAEFARALPRIRRRVKRALALPGLPREKVLAAIVRLLETTFIRVGNEEYARENDSFGLTTLRNRQVSVRGARMKFAFRGKSGVEHRIQLDDPALAAIVRRMQDLPGEELFQYVDEGGETRAIESADVNAYLKELAGEAFTSKDFRTWAGTLLAARALLACPPAASVAEAKRDVQQAVEAAARQLGNTKAVCRKCYIHPLIIESYLEGGLACLRGRSLEAAIAKSIRGQRRRSDAAARRNGAGRRSLVPALARSLSQRRRAPSTLGRAAAAG